MNPVDWSVEAWGAIGSGATALAFLVSAWILGLQLKDRRRIPAEGVTVWVDDRYERNQDSELTRSVSVTLKNVGARPVFDVQVIIGYGHFGSSVTSVGPLAVPTQPVLPPDAEWTWPIGDLLRSVEIEGRLVAEVAFRDAANRWWLRNFDGQLRRWHGRMRRSVTKIADAAVSLDKFGPVSWENPVAVAALFWSVLGDPDTSDRNTQLSSLCTPESLTGWGNFEGIAELLEGHGLASFPTYPAPGIAYVKFPEGVDHAMVVSGPTLIAAKIMTLQHRTDVDPPGWRVFAIGAPVPPEAIPGPQSVPPDGT